MIAPDGGACLAAARGVADALLLAAAGGALHARYLRPAGAATAAQLRRAATVAIALALASLLPWLALQTAAIAGPPTPANLEAVLAHTRWGHAWLARAALLAIALSAPGRARIAAAGLALGTAVLVSHAAAMGNPLLIASDAIHWLAAAVWLGGLVPLALLAARAPPACAIAAARRFSPLGLAAVLALAATAAFQAWRLAGSLPALLGTSYGAVLGLKAAGFAALVAIAASNRRRTRAGRPLTRAALAAEIAIGAAVVLAAGLLSELEPAMHQQPIWPLPFTLSTAALEDPGIAREITLAAAALAAALLAPMLLLLRNRRAALVATLPAAAAAALALPHLTPLIVPATPYTYWHSPTGFTATSIARGAALYPPLCARCHGIDHRGHGPDAARLPEPPADLTAAHLFEHPDGELYAWLTQGIQAPDGTPAMPGFPDLSADDRWALIDAIRAANTGASANTRPLRAPDFDASCTDGIRPLQGLAGQPIRLIAGPATPAPGLLTIAIDPAATPAPGLCATADPDVAAAYAIATGRPALAPGAGALIDSAGWLRAGFASPAEIPALLATIQASPPITAPTPMAMGNMRM